MHSATVVKLDGAYGEGGGSIVRTALTMSVLTGTPVRIHNVRGGLRKPGVNAVDLAITNVLSFCSQAEYNGKMGDEEIFFKPKKPMGVFRDRVDLNQLAKGAQPGSAVLILQSLLLPLSKAGGISRVSCRGGTHVPYSPTYDYFRLVTLPAFARLGIVALPSIESAGYSARGGGEVAIEVEPSALNGFDFTKRGGELGMRAAIVTSELPEHVGLRGMARVNELSRADGVQIKTEFIKLRSNNAGASVTFASQFETGFGGAQALGERGKPMEDVVDEAYYAFIHWLNSERGVDEFLADQLILPAVFSHDNCAFTTSRITSTLLTTIWVVKQFMPARITVKGNEGEPGEISVAI